MAVGTQRDASVNENTPQSARHDSIEGRDASEGDGATRDRYDFQRLERSVEYLLDEHARLGAEREALLAELADREHRVSQLEAEVVDERRRRAVAVEGVDKILSRLEQLQASVGFSAKTGDSDDFNNPDGEGRKAAAQHSASGANQ